MTRDLDPRSVDVELPSRDWGGRTSGDANRTADPCDALTRDFDLPRGPERVRVHLRDRDVALRGSEVRILAAAGTFRVVPAADLPTADRDPGRQARDLTHLRRLGLIQTLPHVSGTTRTTLVTLTPRGRDLLDQARRDRDGEPRQPVYAGIAKPRELAHDAEVYGAARDAAARLAARDAEVRRVVLEEELKRAYQTFLQAANQGREDATGRPEPDAEAIARWARDHDLPCVDGHVQFPDVRLEIEERDGRRTIEDLEVTTTHYRGAHAAAKARSGFTCTRRVGARAGGTRGGGGARSGRGGRPFDPKTAERLLR